MKKVFFIALFVSASLLTSCMMEVKFTPEGELLSRDTTSIPTTTGVNSPMAIKISPGKMNSSASGLVVQGTITTTDKMYALGGDKAVRLTLSRTRVLPQ